MSKEDKFTREDLRDGLTIKMERFVEAYMETGNATEAYRRAYDAENMKPETIHVRACELLQHGKVAARILAIKQKAANRVVLDRAWVLERLMRNARIALGEETVRLKLRVKDQVEEVEMSMRDAAAANKALELLGKTDLRLWVEQVEHGQAGDFTKMTDEELREHALALTKKLGITDHRKLN